MPLLLHVLPLALLLLLQFRSVSEQLYGTQDFCGFVRQQAVQHIK
jgi:hypothetical protein